MKKFLLISLLLVEITGCHGMDKEPSDDNKKKTFDLFAKFNRISVPPIKYPSECPMTKTSSLDSLLRYNKEFQETMLSLLGNNDLVNGFKAWLQGLEFSRRCIMSGTVADMTKEIIGISLTTEEEHQVTERMYELFTNSMWTGCIDEQHLRTTIEALLVPILEFLFLRNLVNYNEEVVTLEGIISSSTISEKETVTQSTVTPTKKILNDLSYFKRKQKRTLNMLLTLLYQKTISKEGLNQIGESLIANKVLLPPNVRLPETIKKTIKVFVKKNKEKFK